MEVDREGVKSLIKPDCIDCNMHLRRLEKTRCKDCNFIFNSSYWNENKSFKRSRVGCGIKFKKFGIENPSEMGKCQLFFFLYTPGLKFEMPPISDELQKQYEGKHLAWHVHHKNSQYWNDHFSNLELVLNVEHNQIAALEKKANRLSEKMIFD